MIEMIYSKCNSREFVFLPAGIMPISFIVFSTSVSALTISCCRLADQVTSGCTTDSVRPLCFFSIRLITLTAISNISRKPKLFLTTFHNDRLSRSLMSKVVYKAGCWNCNAFTHWRKKASVAWQENGVFKPFGESWAPLACKRCVLAQFGPVLNYGIHNLWRLFFVFFSIMMKSGKSGFFSKSTQIKVRVQLTKMAKFS